MGDEVSKSVEPYFLHSSMQRCLDFLQVILAFNEKVVIRSPPSSMERKGSVKQTQATFIQDYWPNKQFYSNGSPIWATLTADAEPYSYLIK